MGFFSDDHYYASDGYDDPTNRECAGCEDPESARHTCARAHDDEHEPGWDDTAHGCTCGWAPVAACDEHHDDDPHGLTPTAVRAAVRGLRAALVVREYGPTTGDDDTP